MATAILYPGFARADVDLNDGGVWVTNQTQGMVGHLNYPSRMLDGAYAANSDRFNVTQHESTVFHSNTDQSKISPVDVANVARGTEVQLPASAVLSQGGNAVAVTDPAAGNVWLTSTGSLPFFSDTELEPAVHAHLSAELVQILSLIHLSAGRGSRGKDLFGINRRYLRTALEIWQARAEQQLVHLSLEMEKAICPDAPSMSPEFIEQEFGERGERLTSALREAADTITACLEEKL